MDNLNERQREIVLTFQEISQIEDIDLSIQILEENQWHIDSAVDNFMSLGRASFNDRRGINTMSSAISRPDNNAPIVQRHHSSNSQSNSPISNTNNSNNSSNNNSSSIGGGSISLNNNMVSNNQNQNNNSSNNNFLSLFTTFTSNRLKWLFQTRPVSINPDSDTRKFIDEFDLQYNSEHPRFHDRSYRSAVATAFESSKFLLVYLHSPMHEDTSKFCQQVLCSPSFSLFVNESMVTWVGKVWDPEAYGLSAQLQASAFPFLALLVCQSDRVVQVVARIQGYMEEVELTDKLRNVMAANTAVVSRIQTENLRRREFSLLREQQDREYREAEEADRRERERRENEERERLRLEEEERQRKELEEAMELSRKLNYEGDIKRRRDELGEEPGLSQADIAVIRFQLPQGAKLSRRFIKSEKVQKLYDFLLVYFFDQGLNIKNILISTHFPKVELKDMSVTIEAVGLFPRGMLYVQDLDA